MAQLGLFGFGVSVFVFLHWLVSVHSTCRAFRFQYFCSCSNFWYLWHWVTHVFLENCSHFTVILTRYISDFIKAGFIVERYQTGMRFLLRVPLFHFYGAILVFSLISFKRYPGLNTVIFFLKHWLLRANVTFSIYLFVKSLRIFVLTSLILP